MTAQQWSLVVLPALQPPLLTSFSHRPLLNATQMGDPDFVFILARSPGNLPARSSLLSSFRSPLLSLVLS